MRRKWLADLLGPLNYLGRCTKCAHQFLSVNVYVWIDADNRRYCERCKS